MTAALAQSMGFAIVFWIEGSGVIHVVGRQSRTQCPRRRVSLERRRMVVAFVPVNLESVLTSPGGPAAVLFGV